MPPSSQTPSSSTKQGSKFLIISLPFAGALLVVLLGYLWYTSVAGSTPTSTSSQQTSSTVNQPAGNTNSDSNVNALLPVPLNKNGNSQPQEDLSVTWKTSPTEIDPDDLGLQVLDPDIKEFYTADEAFTIWDVGTVTTSPFEGDRLLLIERSCYGPCGSFDYRVIDDRTRQGLVFLKDVSAVIEPYDVELFTVTSLYDLPDLHFPEELSVTSGEIAVTLEAEDFTPSTRFDQFFTQERASFSATPFATHATYGQVYEVLEQGYFVVKLPDSTMKFYRLRLPFLLKDDADTGFLVQSVALEVQFSDGDRVNEVFTPVSATICPPRSYDVHRLIDARVQPSGSFIAAGSSAVQFFSAPKDAEDVLYKDIYERTYPSYNPDGVTYEQFLASHPILLWQDPLGRWFRFTQTQHLPALETECPYSNSAL